MKAQLKCSPDFSKSFGEMSQVLTAKLKKCGLCGSRIKGIFNEWENCTQTIMTAGWRSLWVMGEANVQ